VGEFRESAPGLRAELAAIEGRAHARLTPGRPKEECRRRRVDAPIATRATRGKQQPPREVFESAVAKAPDLPRAAPHGWSAVSAETRRGGAYYRLIITRAVRTTMPFGLPVSPGAAGTRRAEALAEQAARKPTCRMPA
jgi:hypothetical protein